jgi:hypothetical protein
MTRKLIIDKSGDNIIKHWQDLVDFGHMAAARSRTHTRQPQTNTTSGWTDGNQQKGISDD